MNPGSSRSVRALTPSRAVRWWNIVQGIVLVAGDNNTVKGNTVNENGRGITLFWVRLQTSS